jgi:hypothetical protein
LKVKLPESSELVLHATEEDLFNKCSLNEAPGDKEQHTQKDLAIPGTSSTVKNITEENIPDIPSPSPLQNPITNYEDISKWPLIDSATRNEIIIRGPANNEMSNENYPRKYDGRHFSNTDFQRIMPNDETFKRRWLVYSKSADKVYCYYCCLFNRSLHSNLGKEGFDDWKHLSMRLKTHETSADHQRAMHSSGCETLYRCPRTAA